MIEECLPTTAALAEDWVLWMELWLRAVRHPELRPVAEELYARLHEWFANEIARRGRGRRVRALRPRRGRRPHARAARRLGVRTMIGDRTIPLERARRAVSGQLAHDLGLGERLER